MDFKTNIDTAITQHQKKVFVKDLHNFLNNCEDNINILSLDCFDTLLWRKTTNPNGVFFDSQHQPTFKQHAINPYLRNESEKRARIKKFYDQHTSEVTLHDIYLATNKELTQETLNNLAQEELLAEINACYAHPKVVQLIHEASNIGMDIIIVSDTYFNEKALRELLQNCLPTKTYEMITHVFCSSDYKRSKQTGLFQDVIQKLSCQPSEILHIGDNYFSDVIGAQKSKIQSSHFIQHEHEVVTTLTRLRAYTAGFLDPQIGHTRPHTNPFAGVISQSKAHLYQPEYLTGYLTLGPILYAFSQYIKLEVEKLKSNEKQPKILFLLRDGYLPYRAFELLTAENKCHPIYISRFTALASSFRSKKDINDYLYQYAHPQLFNEICRQLLIPNEEAAYLSNIALQSTNPTQTFIDLIHDENRLERIFQNSIQLYNRLYRYLEKEADIKEDDSVIFVDLGYTGTAQKKLAPLFKATQNIDIIGRYLIACNTNPTDNTHCGLIDATWYDDRAYSALITFISLFEKLCAITGGSVIDYTEDGKPIFANANNKNNNDVKITTIQDKTLAFIDDAKQFAAQNPEPFDLNILRDTALTELGRLLFFPTEPEINYLSSIEYEVDMGSSRVLSVFDKEQGLAGLKRRGLFFMEKNRGSMRTNFPAELRFASIELSTMLMMQERLKFDLRIPDISLRRESIPIIVMHNGEASNTNIDAIPTYDGYYSLTIPINYGEYQIGIQFGLIYKWLQIDNVEIIQANAVYKANETDHIRSVKDHIHLEGIIQQANDLYECQTTAGLLIYLGNNNLSIEKQVIHIIFRPICRINQ